MKLPIQAEPTIRDSSGRAYLAFKSGINPSQPVAPLPGEPVVAPLPVPPPPLVLPQLPIDQCTVCISDLMNRGNTPMGATELCRVRRVCP